MTEELLSSKNKDLKTPTGESANLLKQIHVHQMEFAFI